MADLTTYTLHRRGDVPLSFDGTLLSPDNGHNIYANRRAQKATVMSGIHVFRTKGGELLLYVGSHGYQRTHQMPQRVYRNADALTRTQIVEACGGSVDSAKGALTALGKQLIEEID